MTGQYLALICCLLQVSKAATIEGQLVFTELMQRMNERDVDFLMKDVMVHLEGAPGKGFKIVMSHSVKNGLSVCVF